MALSPGKEPAAMTIRTDSLSHACEDLSAARIRGEALPVVVELDDATRLDVVAEDEGDANGVQWHVEASNGGLYDGKSWPI